MKSYDYAQRQGVRPLSWDEIAAMAAQLAEALEQRGVDLIVGVARAGLIPATMVACSLRRELYPVRVSRRVEGEVRFASPMWYVPVLPVVAGKTVAVIDEIADTGETLALVVASVRDSGAAEVVTACLVRHSWADPLPDVVALVSDELVLFPWDGRILVGGQWQVDPELAAALDAQGLGGTAGDIR